MSRWNDVLESMKDKPKLPTPAHVALRLALEKVAQSDQGRRGAAIRYRVWEPEASPDVDTGWQTLTAGGDRKVLQDRAAPQPRADQPWRVNYEHTLETAEHKDQNGRTVGTYWTRKACRMFTFATEQERTAFVELWEGDLDPKRGPTYRLSKSRACYEVAKALGSSRHTKAR